MSSSPRTTALACHSAPSRATARSPTAARSPCSRCSTRRSAASTKRWRPPPCSIPRPPARGRSARTGFRWQTWARRAPCWTKPSSARGTGDPAGMLTRLNALRRAPRGSFLTAGGAIPPLGPLAAPGGPTATVNLLFSERARWLWLTSHRLSDLRRLERQYLRPDNQVFPTGPYFKSGLQYGPDVNLPVPIDELNNPNFL